MYLRWEKVDGEWPYLEELDTMLVFIQGVYVIWFMTSRGPTTLYVGQGNISNRLVSHQIDKRFTGQSALVSWAEIAKSEMNGVEAYLSDKLKPVHGSRTPIAEYVEVNLPWEIV